MCGIKTNGNIMLIETFAAKCGSLKVTAFFFKKVFYER